MINLVVMFVATVEGIELGSVMASRDCVRAGIRRVETVGTPQHDKEQASNADVYMERLSIQPNILKYPADQHEMFTST